MKSVSANKDDDYILEHLDKVNNISFYFKGEKKAVKANAYFVNEIKNFLSSEYVTNNPTAREVKSASIQYHSQKKGHVIYWFASLLFGLLPGNASERHWLIANIYVCAGYKFENDLKTSRGPITVKHIEEVNAGKGLVIYRAATKKKVCNLVFQWATRRKPPKKQMPPVDDNVWSVISQFIK
jgi:hypothetical protein